MGEKETYPASSVVIVIHKQQLARISLVAGVSGNVVSPLYSGTSTVLDYITRLPQSCLFFLMLNH